jgi:putative hydrolase of the HAD superfamily
MKPVDLFLMDLGNVLVKFDHALIARKLSKLSRQPVFAIVSKFIRSGLGEAFDEGKISPEEFVSRVIKDLKLRVSPEEFKTIWNEIFFDNPGMEALVARIKERYPIFVISDTNRLHFEHVRSRFPILGNVQRFILSYEVGVRKPHPKIFVEAIRQAQTTAERTFFVDDRAEVVEAASKLGFQAVVFKDTDSFAQDLSRMQLLS